MTTSTTATVPETSTADIYFMSSRARNKLAKESYKPELNLRKLVAHANLMDSLYDELEYRRGRYQQFEPTPVKQTTQTTQTTKQPTQTPNRVTFAIPTPVTPVTPVTTTTTLEDIPEYISSDEETESEEESEEEDDILDGMDAYSLTVDNSVHIVGEPVLSETATFGTHHKVSSSENLTLDILQV